MRCLVSACFALAVFVADVRRRQRGGAPRMPLEASSSLGVSLYPYSCQAHSECQPFIPDYAAAHYHFSGSLINKAEPYNDNVWNALAEHINHTTSRGVLPVAIIVGSHDLSEDSSGFVVRLLRYPVHVVVVEPNPRVAQVLQERIASLLSSTVNVRFQFVSGAVCAQDGEQVSFWVGSTRLIDDSPGMTLYDRTSLNRLASLDRDILLKNLRGELWTSHVRGNLSSYVEQIKVRCLTPSSLLDEAGVAPADVVAITIDAEGYDVPIAMQFIDTVKFAPTLFEFEWVMSGNKSQALINRLSALSYDVMQDSFNMVAMMRAHA